MIFANFFVVALALLEALVTALRGRPAQSFEVSFSNIACGFVQRTLLAVLLASLTLVSPEAMRNLHRAPAMPWWQWGLLFVVVDFHGYWVHRLHHAVRFFWAAHSVHHQSPQMNLSVGLRVSPIEALTGLPLFAPLVWAGISVPAIVLMHTLVNVGQLFTHTHARWSLGPLDAVFVTPSHHRVHHGTDAKYRDKNFGSCLIVWDRLFCTFQREEEEPRYGTLEPPKSLSPWAAIAVEWRAIVRDVRAARGASSKLRMLVAFPLANEASAFPQVRASEARRAYAVAQTMLLFVAGSVVMATFDKVPFPIVLAMLPLMIFSLDAVARTLEGAAWSWMREGVRVAVVLALLAACVRVSAST